MSLKKIIMSTLSLGLLFSIAMIINGMSVSLSIMDTGFFLMIFVLMSRVKKEK